MSGLFSQDVAVQVARPEAVAYRVLARKYRPIDLADLIGQDAMVRTLRNAFALGRIAHAFMLTGVRGVGKTSTARIMARALNCTGPSGDGGPTATPCGVCAECRAILVDRHPDVVEMDAASRTGVDDVREIIEAARFRPMQARTKVFIVDEVHMLSRNAFNALLKTLEEPPGHVKFIFATTEWRKVPVTVLSRCQRFDLRRVSIAEMSARFTKIAGLEGVSVAPAALAMIAQAADGSVRDGLSLLDQAIALGGGGSTDQDQPEIGAALVADMLGLADRAVVFDLMEAVVVGDLEAVLAITDRAHERGADLGVMLGDLLELSHLLTRLRSVPALRSSNELTELERVRGAALAGRLGIPALTRIWQMLLKGLTELDIAPDRRAAAEMVLIRLCHVADMPSPGELVSELRRSPTAPASAALALARQDSISPAPIARAGALALRREAIAAPRAAMPSRFRDLIALAVAAREPLLGGHLQQSVHLVRYAPPIIELRPDAAAPRDLATKLAALLLDATGVRWTIALSNAPGEPTLAAKDAAEALATRRDAGEHPLIRAVLEAFPGAVLRSIELDEARGISVVAGEIDGNVVPPLASSDTDATEASDTDATETSDTDATESADADITGSAAADVTGSLDTDVTDLMEIDL